MEVTLFEIHLDESPVTAHAPFSGADSREESTSGTDIEVGDEETDEESGGGKIGAVVALVVLVGLAMAVRRFVGGGSSSPGPIGDESETEAASTVE